MHKILKLNLKHRHSDTHRLRAVYIRISRAKCANISKIYMLIDEYTRQRTHLSCVTMHEISHTILALTKQHVTACSNLHLATDQFGECDRKREYAKNEMCAGVAKPLQLNFKCNLPRPIEPFFHCFTLDISDLVFPHVDPLMA